MHTQIKRKRTREREMQAFWLSLKDNVKCGNKITDVIKLPPKFGKGSSFVLQKKEKINKQDEQEEESFPFMKTPARSLVVSKPNNAQARLYGKTLFTSVNYFTIMYIHIVKFWQSLVLEIRQEKS